VHSGRKQLQDIRHPATVPSGRGLRLLAAGPTGPQAVGSPLTL
jgi:hypothetical protein